jgi:hypothetical protein
MTSRKYQLIFFPSRYDLVIPDPCEAGEYAKGEIAPSTGSTLKDLHTAGSSKPFPHSVTFRVVFRPPVKLDPRAVLADRSHPQHDNLPRPGRLRHLMGVGDRSR